MTRCPGSRARTSPSAPSRANRLLTLTGRMRQPFLAIDLRLQSHRWMKGLVERGGRIQIESVTVGRLEEIAAEHELTLVAAGRAEPCRIFERHAARSVHDAPQCQLALMCIKGPKMRFDDLPLVPVKFNALPGMGEAFYVPHHHNDVGRMTRGAAPAPRGVPGRGRRRDGAREGLTRLRAGQAEGRPVEAGSVGWRPLAVFAEARRATRGPGRPPARRRRT